MRVRGIGLAPAAASTLFEAQALNFVGQIPQTNAGTVFETRHHMPA